MAIAVHFVGLVWMVPSPPYNVYAVSPLNETYKEPSGPWGDAPIPHPPFDPPAAYLDRYDPAALPPPLFRPSDLERQTLFARVRSQTVEAVDPTGAPALIDDYDSQSERGYRPPPSYDGRAAKAAYYAMIELIDSQLGRIISHLEAIDELENTIIIFSSDHGELLGDHGLMYKGCRFFEGLVHVPLIFSGPANQKGTRSKALVELVDIAPTLLELTGAAIPERMQGRAFTGILRGTSQTPDEHKDTVFCDFNDSIGYSPVPDDTQASMTFDGRYKLVLYHSHDIGELFDLAADPGEFENLFYEDTHRNLRDKLILRHANRFARTLDAGTERVSNA